NGAPFAHRRRFFAALRSASAQYSAPGSVGCGRSPGAPGPAPLATSAPHVGDFSPPPVAPSPLPIAPQWPTAPPYSPWVVPIVGTAYAQQTLATPSRPVDRSCSAASSLAQSAVPHADSRPSARSLPAR